MHRSRLLLASALAALAVLALATTAHAKPKPNVWLLVRPAPSTPLVGAKVVVTDAAGKVVGRGVTGGNGSELLRVKVGKGHPRPYLYTATGGTVDGKPFKGTVLQRSSSIGLRRRIHHMNAATTAAVRYAERHGGRVSAAESRILKGLGLNARRGQTMLKHSTVAVDRRRMNSHHAAHGGFDGTVDVLVEALEGKRRFPNFAVRKAENPRSRLPKPRAGAVPSSIPCSMSAVQAPSNAVNIQVAAAGIMMGAGLISGFLTKDPSLFLNGAVGMAMSQTPGMTTASMLASIAADLQCISNQIAAVEKTVDQTALAVSLQSAQDCQNNTYAFWDQYQTALEDMSSDPPKATYAKDNPVLVQLFNSDSGLVLTNLMACVTSINSALFNNSGGLTAAWAQSLTNYKAGDENPNDAVAMSQQSNADLQAFLAYWSNYEYQAAVLVNEYYNYQATFYTPLGSVQNNALSPRASSGVVCPAAAPSITAVVPSVANLCQAQQNIANVWPGDLYTDEVLWYKNTTQKNSFGFSGNALSAVPVAWGMSSSTPATSPTLITPNYLSDREIDKYDSRWNAKTAVATYNGQAATDIGGLNQSIFYPRGTADPTIIPDCGGNCGNAFPGLYQYGPYFSSWLNAAKATPDANGSYASANLTPGSTSSPAWQVLAKDGTVVFDNGDPTPKCGKNTAYDSAGNRYTYYAHYTSHNTIYSPHPWTANSGGTIGGGSTDPCSITVPIAFLKARAVTQGTLWPAAPVIANQSGSSVGVGVQLTATNCPTGGCTWSISDPDAPSGLTLSVDGVFSWPGAAPGTTGSVQIVAGNAQTYSAPVTLTVIA